MRIRLRHQRLQEALAKSGRSQNAWALALGLDSGHLSKLVNGQRPYPGEPTRQRLLEGLGVPFEELFEVETRRRRATPPRAPRRAAPRRTRKTTMSFVNDVRYAFRMVRQHPGFSLLAILIVALGVGANSAVFARVHSVLWTPLPFPESDRLVLMWTTDEARGGGGKVSFPDYLDWSERTKTVEGLAAFQEDSFVLGSDDGAERIFGEMVTHRYFELLGATPVYGRTPTASEPEPVVVVSEGLAKRRLGGAAHVVGRTIELRDATFTVIGVLPESFRGFSDAAQVWVPMRTFDHLNPELTAYDILRNRGTRWHSVLGRLRTGASLTEAKAEMDSVADDLSAAYPRSNELRGIEVRSAHAELVSDERASLSLLSAAVGALLLLACVNLANLFLVRVLARRGELSLRIALGASRGRLVKQLLTESGAIAIAGGALGLLFAAAISRVLDALTPHAASVGAAAEMDPAVFSFSFALSLVVGVAFGFLPAHWAARAEPGTGLKDGARAGFGRRRALAGFAVAEVAIATLLLVGAGLVLKSFRNMHRFDPGFETSRLLTMQFHVPSSFAGERDLDALVDQVRRAPGVDAAAIASHVYFGGGYMSGDLTVEGFEPKAAADELKAYRHFVTDDYFDAMGIPILRGEPFGPRERVAIVNRSFAERMWPNESAVGKRLMAGAKRQDKPWLTVVGVAGDVSGHLRATDVNRLPQVYFPMREGGLWSRSLVVRTSTASAEVVPSLRAALRELHPGIAVFAVATMDELLSRQRASMRYVAYLMGAFALLALSLAALGLYGVIAHSVGQLTREIGIRVAVGATTRDVLTLVMRPATILIASGLAGGALASLGATRFVASLLYEVAPLDMGTLASAAAVLAGISVAACYVPARRAARIDPVRALRHE